jgi:hypothetical protein
VSRQPWVVGICWRCDARNALVMWLGPVLTERFGNGPFHACEPCIQRLEELVDQHHHEADRST